MPSPVWKNEDGIPIVFVAADEQVIPGRRLAGAVIQTASHSSMDITIQEWERPPYHLSFRLLHYFTRRQSQVRESQEGLRLEAVLTGELITTDQMGIKTKVRAGQYFLTREPIYLAQIKKFKSCSYFVSYYPPELIRDFGIAGDVPVSSPRNMPEAMSKLIHEVLHHPYAEQLHTFYYQHIVRELMLIHLTVLDTRLPAELSEADIAAVYQADAILSADLSEHYSIHELSGMAGTNAFKLKRGFRLIFKTGVFGRLIHRRMEQAKILLTTTNKSIKEIAYESGYNTVAGFITAFRKRTSLTPQEWREQNRG